MATKSTHKKKNFNKKELAKKLDKLAEKVSSKNIYVVSKLDDDYYCVLDYKTKKPLIVEIPTKQIADKLCNKANRSGYGTHKLKEIASLIQDYNRYYVDSLYFLNTITKSADKITVESARHRLDLTKGRIKRVMAKIMSA